MSRLSPYEHELMESNWQIGSLTAHDLFLEYVRTGNAEKLAWMSKWYPPATDHAEAPVVVTRRDVAAGTARLVTDPRILRDFAQKPELLFTLSPRGFEEFTAELLARLGYKGVVLGRGTKDKGVDVTAFLEHAFGVEKLIVQCKKHSRSNKISEPVITQLLGNVGRHDATRGLIVTTSTLTRPAEMLVKSFSLKLSAADLDEVVALLRKVT